MSKLFWVLVLVFCLVAVQGKKKSAFKQKNESEDETPSEGSEASKQEGAEEEPTEDVPTEEGQQQEEDTPSDHESDPESEESSGEEQLPESQEFQCNLKFKRVGCYADKSKNKKPLKSFIMSDIDMGNQAKRGKLPAGETFNTELPKFACKCANEALNSGNAIFGIQNIAECWTGPDNSKYDKDGPSEDCVTFDYAPCDAATEICAGKKHANFVYYVDSPDHTKSQDEIQRELLELSRKNAKKAQKKKGKAKKGKKTGKKKGKKGKKE